MRQDHKYDVNYFISKFEAIPVEQWAVGTFKAYNFDACCDKRCALGHCGVEEAEYTTLEALALERLMPADVVAINDGVEAYAAWGGNPKERILEALRRVKSCPLD
jgi:hypothetical protein